MRPTDFQFLRAVRALFPTHLLRRAVSAHRPPPRDRCLPRWMLPALVVAWFWHPQDRLPAVARWFLPSPSTRTPSGPAIYAARGRLGWRPMWLLRKWVARPLADPGRDPEAFFAGRRLLALDGTTLTVPDTPANAAAFGRPRNQHRPGGSPLARVVAVCEVGTHALIDWVARGYHRSEVDLAARLLARVPPGSLLLADRTFHGFDLWAAATRGRFDLLIRVQSGPKLAADRVLPDGSFLSRVRPRRGPGKAARAIPVRVIRYRWTDARGTAHLSRLVTSLLDPVRNPAATLVDLYHRRWEQEGVFREIKGQLAGRVTQVRARDPVRVLQEIDGLFLGHFAVRWVMLQAARQRGVPAVAVSFVGAVRVLKARLGQAPVGPRRWSRWWAEVLAEVGRERVQARRPRQCPRARKTTRSHWPVKKPGQKEGRIPTLTVVPPPP